jgi:hypothetical protein
MEVEMTTPLDQRISHALADDVDVPALVIELEAEIRQSYETAAAERRYSYAPGIPLDDAKAAVQRAVAAEAAAQSYLAQLPALRAKAAAAA